MTFTIIMILIIVFFILYDLISRKDIDKKIKKWITDNWAKMPEQEPNEREAASFSSYFNNWKINNSNEPYIDNITWNDLEMDKVFNRINNTISTAGEEYLYSLLRRPVFIGSELKERSRLLDFFLKEKNVREKVQFVLARLGKRRCIDVSDYFFNEDIIYKKRVLYYLLAGFFLLSAFFMVFVDIKIGAAAFALSLITNATVYYRIKNSIEYRIIPLGYIIQLVGTANTLMKLEIPELKAYREVLAEALAKVRKIGRKGFSLLSKAQNPITEYAKSLLFAELIAFESCHNLVVEYRIELKRIFDILGYIDSMISIASYRECAGVCCQPEFTGCREGKIHINAVDLYHPLIKEPVTNTCSFVKPVLVTGSNASGKSTFLKAVAISAIFAQTMAICLAREFRLSRCMVYTSMALKDNLINKESYFIVELKSLKRIIDAVNTGLTCLCIVDEVLRGTNTVERIAASSEVLASLGSRNCMCLAATHDIELASILEGVYENYHFRETVTQDNNVLFDYTLYPGKSSTKNALKLLKVMGYDNKIVSRAQARSDRFMKEGVWHRVQVT